jgi:hypothetical protein
MTFAFRATAVVCLCLLVGACDIKVGENGVSVDVASGKATDEWTRTYTLPKSGRLEIINVNGPIEVFPATGSTVEVVDRREVRTRTDEEAKARLAKAEMIEDRPDHVKIQMKPGDPNAARAPRTGQHRVRGVPRWAHTSFRTENGAVRPRTSRAESRSLTNGPIVGRGLGDGGRTTSTAGSRSACRR